MKKLLFIILFAITLFANDLTATDKNKTMTDEEFLKQFMALEKRQEEAKAKTTIMKKNTEKLKKLNKTLNKLTKILGIDK